MVWHGRRPLPYVLEQPPTLCRRKTWPTRPIRWGLLGTSRINEKLIRGARATDDAEIVAVGSRAAATGQAFAKANGIDRVHASYEDLLADPDLDAVYIPLPNALHHAWTLKAIEAGKHVLCEKPYSRYPQEVEEAWDAAEAAGVVLMEAFMWRHTPQAAKLVELAAGHRRAHPRALHLQPPSPGRRGHPCLGTAAGRLADGRGLLLRLRCPAHRRRGAGAGLRRSRSPRPKASTAASPGTCASRQG